MNRARPWLALLLGWGPQLSGCTPPPSEALSATQPRVVLAAEAIAVLSKHGPVSGLPERVQFGGALGQNALLLRFPGAEHAAGPPALAFLTLLKADGEAPDPTPVKLEAWRVSSDWQADELRTWAELPELALPESQLEFESAPEPTVRIDVTELLRFAAAHPNRDFGIALLARGGSGTGVSFTTGMSGGRAPLLELYPRSLR